MYINVINLVSVGKQNWASEDKQVLQNNGFGYIWDQQEGTCRQRSGKGAIRKRFPLQKPRWEKNKLIIRYLYH